jgi:hypothetical protein
MGLEFRVEGSLLFLGHEVGDTAQPAHVLLLLFVQVRHHDEVGEVAVDAANFQVLKAGTPGRVYDSQGWRSGV